MANNQIITVNFVEETIRVNIQGGATYTYAPSGDMLKSVYDIDNDGKVDLANDSEKLGGYDSSEYQLISDMPTIPTALSQLTKDINFDERYYTESETNTLLDNKVTKNANITSGTYTKLTVDNKGLVTSGTSVLASDLPAGIDATKIGTGVISNTEFGYLNNVSSNIQTQISSKQATLISGTNIKTINGATVLGSGNIVISGGDVSNLVPYSGAIQNVDLGTYELTTDGIQLDLINDTVAGQGKLYWNANDLTANLGLSDNVNLQIGQEYVYRVKADSNIANGQPVFATGSTGNSGRINVNITTADSSKDSKYFLGLATENLLATEEGFVTAFGLVRDVLISDIQQSGETWVVGDVLYVSATESGKLTKTKPASPNLHISTAMVLFINPTHVTLFARPLHGLKVNDIHDVYTNGKSNNDVLAWNSVNSRWENLNLNSIYYTETEIDTKLIGKQNRHGFENRTDSVLSFVDGTRTFTITGTFKVFNKGTLYNKTTESIVITNTNGLWFIYYDANTNVLTASQTAWVIGEAIPIAVIFWNTVNGLIGDERHGLFDPQEHKYHHLTDKTKYASGLSGTFTNTTFSVDNGIIFDEDLQHDIPTTTTARTFYRSGANFTFTAKQANYTQISGSIQYDNSGTLTPASVNNFVAIWCYASNFIDDGIIFVLGQRQDVTIANARANNTPESLNLGALPLPELKLLYRVIIKNDATPYEEVTDYRTTSVTGSSVTLTDHQTLTNRSAADAHPISSITDLQTTLDAKLLNSMTTNKLLGRGTAGTGVVEEITLGTNLSLSGTTLNATGGSGGHTIQDNGTDLTARTNLDIRGNYNLIKDDSVADSTKLLLTGNLPKDSYINQNVYPALEWIWYHSDGYWYMVTMVLIQISGYVGNPNYEYKVYKTKDWINFDYVCGYENASTGGSAFVEPKIAMDSNGNILILNRFNAINRLVARFFDASNNYTSSYALIEQNTTYGPETTISLNVSSDDKFGVAFFQKHSGSTTYSQLMYVERSAGTSGTWGSVEILGSTPVRAATVTEIGTVSLHYTSGNEPIIAFLNNQSATSSKGAIAKKVSGSWTIYDSTETGILNSVIDSNNNVFMGRNSIVKFDYSLNSFSSNIVGFRFLAVNTNNDIFTLGVTSVAAFTFANVYYVKNNANTFHRAVRPYFQIGAVISANAYSSFGIFTVIPYSRQRLTNAWHLVVRTDGAIYMEII